MLLLLVLLLVLLLGIEGTAEAFTDINFAGELDIATTIHQFPTRDQGTMAFSIPSLKLDIEIPLRDNNQFFIELESAEYRDDKSKRHDTQVRQAYLSVMSALPEGAELRYGLIPDPWIEREKEQWQYDFWGMNSYLPLIKYKYSSWSDLGLMYKAELPEDWGIWALSATNGEGAVSEETGPNKQVQFLLGLTKKAPFYFMLSYVQGAYENFDEKIKEKRRLLAHFSYEEGGNLLALEYFDLKDPADVIANGADLSAVNGTSVSGQGVSVFGKLHVAQNWDLFLRADWLNPVKEDAEVSLISLIGGASFEMSEDILWALSYESVQYGEHFSASPRDEGRFVVATRVSF